jgi:nucleotide-binding universal stress UspA family protein
MFKHVLLPTDGSRLSRKAVRAGIAFAKKFGARVTVYHAVESFLYMPGAALFRRRWWFEAAARKQVRRYLDDVSKLAQAAGVTCASQASTPDTVYQGIIDTARKNKCDVTFMASHGRGGVISLVLGSVTLKVLAHSKIPVVVFR